MPFLSRTLILSVLFASVSGCAHPRPPKPIMEPQVKVAGVEYDEKRDLRACRQEVHAAAPLSIQPRWLPPLGGDTHGIVLGTVDSPHPVWPSLQAYRQEMERCLVGRGYQIRGWH